MLSTNDADFIAGLEEIKENLEMEEHGLFEPDADPDFVEPPFFDIADKLVDLYITYRQRYVMMINGAIFIPKRKESGPIALSNSTICKHLNKKCAIGVFAGAYSSKFICFDVDDGSQETVRKIIDLSERFGIPRNYVYVSSSGGKGYHVEVFFDNIVYTEKLRIFYDWIILHGKLNPGKVEFRPTHTQAIKLPLSKHVKTGNICWYVNRDTFEPYAYESYICSIEQFSAEKFNNLVQHCGIRKPFSGGDALDELESLTDPNRPRMREFTEQEKIIMDNSSAYPDITEPGQRHQLTRYLAVRNRCDGMTMEESEKALSLWWAAQDHTITGTPDEEALADIQSLVAWTFSEGFKLPVKIKKLTITKDMLRASLIQKTKTERKLVFLIACFCSVYGRMNMGYDRMAKYLDCSAVSVKKIIPRLAEAGYIRYVPGRTTRADGKFIRKPNTYWINQDGFIQAKTLDVEWDFDEPLVYEAKESAETDDFGRLRTFIPELEPEGFTDFYYEVLSRTISEKSLISLLTRSEFGGMKN